MCTDTDAAHDVLRGKSATWRNCKGYGIKSDCRLDETRSPEKGQYKQPVSSS